MALARRYDPAALHALCRQQGIKNISYYHDDTMAWARSKQLCSVIRIHLRCPMMGL